jgi:hypothetical protein
VATTRANPTKRRELLTLSINSEEGDDMSEAKVMMTKPRLFALNDAVTIEVSGEQGTVTGIAEYAKSPPAALVRYKAADGRAREEWWPEDALVAVVKGSEGEAKTG